MTYEPYDHFEVCCWAGRYGSHWVVRRLRDTRIMTSSPRVFDCLKWLRSWGPDRT